MIRFTTKKILNCLCFFFLRMDFSLVLYILTREDVFVINNKPEFPSITCFSIYGFIAEEIQFLKTSQVSLSLALFHLLES